MLKLIGFLVLSLCLFSCKDNKESQKTDTDSVYTQKKKEFDDSNLSKLGIVKSEIVLIKTKLSGKKSILDKDTVSRLISQIKKIKSFSEQKPEASAELIALYRDSSDYSSRDPKLSQTIRVLHSDELTVILAGDTICSSLDSYLDCIVVKTKNKTFLISRKEEKEESCYPTKVVSQNMNAYERVYSVAYDHSNVNEARCKKEQDVKALNDSLYEAAISQIEDLKNNSSYEAMESLKSELSK